MQQQTHVSVDHRDAVMRFVTSLRQTLPHIHMEFVNFLKEMNDSVKLGIEPRPTNFTTHVRVIKWFVAKRALEPKHAKHYHTLVMSYIKTIAVHDSHANASVDFLLYAGYLLLT
jgi:hypothetical protein